MAAELTGWIETTPEILVELVGTGPQGPKGDPGTTDHRELIHRDEANQHPIGAIEGLVTALNSKVAAGDALSNWDIQKILEG